MKLILTALALALASCATNQSIDRHSAHRVDTMEARRVAALRDGERIQSSVDHSVSICKAIPVTGTRNPRRICHTRDEWMAMRRNGEETVRTTHREGTIQVLGAPMNWDSNGD